SAPELLKTILLQMKSRSIVQRHLDSAQILTVKAGTMNYPRASCGVSKNIYESFSEVVTPECLIGGPVRVSPVVSLVEPSLQACRNDGLRGDSKSRLRSKLAGS